MKTYLVNTLQVEEEFIDFFMVKTIGIKVGSNKKNYLDVTLGDFTGEINGKKWDVSDEEIPTLNNIKEGDIVKVKALVNEWNGIKQLRIARIRKAAPNDDLNMADYVKAAPEDPAEMYSYIMERAGAIKDEGLRRLAVSALEDNRERLLYYPAAMRNRAP